MIAWMVLGDQQFVEVQITFWQIAIKRYAVFENWHATCTHANCLALALQIPIAITVEGANTLTRSLIQFGQGLTRSHPHLYPLIQSIQHGDDQAGFQKHLNGTDPLPLFYGEVNANVDDSNEPPPGPITITDRELLRSCILGTIDKLPAFINQPLY